MDLNTAIQLGLLEQYTENIPTTDLNNKVGQIIPITYGDTTINYTVITTIYGNDLATEWNPESLNKIVSFGLILQDPNKNVVIAIRGTDGIWEWIQDAIFGQRPCPFLSGAGNTEDGFTDVYTSLRIGVNADSNTVTNALKAVPAMLNFQQPIGSVTVIGHSLGGALATLLALDVAANTGFKPIVYTYASPLTGDPLFVSKYNELVPNTFRIANLCDMVPTLPRNAPGLPYVHVETLYALDPRPNRSVKPNPGCQHHITTYLFLLSQQAGGPVEPLCPECDPEPDVPLA